jgi:hypothetical protein
VERYLPSFRNKMGQVPAQFLIPRMDVYVSDAETP